jgi:hydrogenase/urease accessory protein HupE
MLSTPLDAFIFMGMIASIIFIAAVIAKSPILGSFAGLMYVLDGIYGLVNNLTPVTTPMSQGISFSVLGLGLFLFLQAAVEVR